MYLCFQVACFNMGPKYNSRYVSDVLMETGKIITQSNVRNHWFPNLSILNVNQYQYQSLVIRQSPKCHQVLRVSEEVSMEIFRGY